jgi:hypothetical protein
MEIRRLHLASLQGLDGRRWPVHGFVVTRGDDAVLVDTGVGGPQQALDDWRVVNRSVADPDPSTTGKLPPGQASDLPAWRDSLRRLQALDPDRVHFCHHTDVIHR